MFCLYKKIGLVLVIGYTVMLITKVPFGVEIIKLCLHISPLQHPHEPVVDAADNVSTSLLSGTSLGKHPLLTSVNEIAQEECGRAPVM